MQLTPTWEVIADRNMPGTAATVARFAATLLVLSAITKAATAQSAAPTASTLAALQQELDADDFQTRERATAELQRLGSDALPVVAKSAASSNPEVATRGFAILQAWLETDDPKLSADAMAAIEALAKSPSPSVVRRANELLAQAAVIADRTARARLATLGAEFGEAANDSPVGGVPELQALHVGKEWKGTNADLRQLRQLVGLWRLSFRESKVDAQAVAAIAGARVAAIDFGKTDLDDNCLRALPHFETLKELDLSETLVGDEGIAQLIAFQKLERLLLRGTLVSDKGLADLQRLPALAHLQLSKTRISSKGFLLLADFPHLQSLDLQQTKFNAKALRSLSTNTTLRVIEAQGTPVTIADVQDFQRTHPRSSIKIELKDARQR